MKLHYKRLNLAVNKVMSLDLSLSVALVDLKLSCYEVIIN